MKHRSISFSILFVLTLASTINCGGPIPSQASAKNAISHHMAHYAKKYPASPMGKKNIQKIDVYSLGQEKRGYASATAFLTSAQSEVYQTQFILKHEPFGWQVSSWEILQGP